MKGRGTNLGVDAHQFSILFRMSGRRRMAVCFWRLLVWECIWKLARITRECRGLRFAML